MSPRLLAPLVFVFGLLGAGAVSAMNQDAVDFAEASMAAWKSCANKAVIAGTRIGYTGRFADTESCVAGALDKIEPAYQKAYQALSANNTARQCLQTYYGNWINLMKSLPTLQLKPPSSVLLSANGGERRLKQYWQFVVSAR